MVVKNCTVGRPIIVRLQIISVYIYWRSYCSDTIHSSFYMYLEMMTPAETGNIEILMQTWVKTVLQSTSQMTREKNLDAEDAEVWALINAVQLVHLQLIQGFIKTWTQEMRDRLW